MVFGAGPSVVLAKKISGYLIIPAGAISDTALTAILRVTNANDLTVEEFLSSHYKDALFSERLKLGGIDPEFVIRAKRGTEISTLKVDSEKETSDNGVGFIGGYLILRMPT